MVEFGALRPALKSLLCDEFADEAERVGVGGPQNRVAGSPGPGVIADAETTIDPEIIEQGCLLTLGPDCRRHRNAPGLDTMAESWE